MRMLSLSFAPYIGRMGGSLIGDLVCGDESIVPHKGVFYIRQFI